MYATESKFKGKVKRDLFVGFCIYYIVFNIQGIVKSLSIYFLH